MENERLKKELEELRGQVISPFPFSGMGKQPLMAWKEFGKDREEMCEELVWKIDNAKDVLIRNWHDAPSWQIKEAIREVWDALDPEGEDALESEAESQA